MKNSAAFCILAASVLLAQSDTAPKFEVASVKPNTDPSVRMRGLRPMPNGRLTATNATLLMMLVNAYGMQPYQFLGGPNWMDTEGFNIEAKGDANANREQVLAMLRSLLEARFQLRTHRETPDLPIYALTVAKGGPKLKAPKEGGCAAMDPNQRAQPGTALPPCGAARVSMMPSAIGIVGGKVPMSEFVGTLKMVLGRPVVDRTAITELFDLDLRFARDQVVSGIPQMMGPPGEAAPADAATPPSILTAIQEQLGLRLESTKGPVEVLVIDHVERPSAN
jgi:uncharacterized protein (TIGR03435 family)